MSYYSPSDAELATLRWFRFVRSAGGSDNSPDRFEGHIPYRDLEDMLEKLRLLGASPRSVPPPDPDAAIDEKSVISHRIQRFPAYENPGKVTIFALNVLIYVLDQTIEITVCGTADGNVWQLSDADLRACQALERQFLLLGWRP